MDCFSTELDKMLTLAAKDISAYSEAEIQDMATYHNIPIDSTNKDTLCKVIAGVNVQGYMKKCIGVLSYNVSWEAMTNSSYRKGFKSCINNACANNIRRIIDCAVYNNIDFIALIELAGFGVNYITDHVNSHFYSQQPPQESIGLIYSRQYNLVESHYGNTSTTDSRPLCLFIFEPRVIFIIAHLKHYPFIQRWFPRIFRLKNKFENSINSAINSFDINIENFKNYRIIMTGDFNYDIKGFETITIKMKKEYFIYQKRVIT